LKAPPQKRRGPRGAGPGEAEHDSKDTPAIAQNDTTAQWQVRIGHSIAGKTKVFSTHDNCEVAEVEVAKFRVHMMLAQVRRADHGPYGSRRRFLIAALMAAWVGHERVVERIVA
jgi:hypothetical protein